MKTHHWFSRTRLYSAVRFSTAAVLLSGAAAMAFVAINPSGPFLLGKSDNTHHPVNKFRQGRDQSGGNRRALAGAETDRGPLTAAEEAYANRDRCARDADLRRRDRHAVRRNWRAERVG